MTKTRTIGAAKFKEQCLRLLEGLDAEGLIVTKHGRPIARILPAARASGELWGTLAKKIKIKGDLVSTGLRWDAES